MRRDDNRPNLLVGKELDAGVGEDAKECCGMAFEEAPETLVALDVADSQYKARPATGVLGELRV